MIRLTVGLPMFRAKHIGWLAFESLIRQIDIDFEWELLIAEESEAIYEPFGEETVMSYANQLEHVGCKRIKYFSYPKWRALPLKWRTLARNSSRHSMAFLLHAADCYSSPMRLKATLDLMKKGIDWVQSDNHTFYNISDERVYTTNRLISFLKKPHPCGADMASRTKWARMLPIERFKKSGIDSWFYNSCKTIKFNLTGKQFRVATDTSDNYKYALNVHGLNNISKRDDYFCIDCKHHFDVCDRDLSEFIPIDILERLKTLKQHTIGWKLLSRKSTKI